MQDGFVDLYANPHKGLRNAMNACLVKLGQLDPSDAADVAEGVAALRDLLRWCEHHLELEENFVHTAIDRKRPGALIAHVRGDHESHQRDFALLRGDADAVERALGEPAATRKARARQLYLSFSRFVGENFAHMAFEETEVNALIAELFTADEVHAILGRILASESQDQLMWSVRWVIPALDPDTRATVLTGARQSIEPAVFEQLLGAMQGTLSARDYEKLRVALGTTRAA